MLRLLCVSGLVLFVLVSWPQPAHADWWDVLGELSGAGPSPSRGNLSATVYCSGVVKQSSGWFRPLDTRAANGPCLFVDVRRFKSEEDARFFPVRTEVYEAGPTFRLLPPLELGVGLGLIHFDSSGVKANRFTISLPRVVFKPFLMIDSKKDDGRWGFFQLYFRETRIIGELTEADFRPKPGVTFQADQDLVESSGFLIDITALLRFLKP